MLQTISSPQNQMKKNDLLEELSRKLIHLSGNDLINKKLSGHGKGRIFNICDEIPQFVLNRLQVGKKFKLVGLDKTNGLLKDESSKRFLSSWEQKLNDLKFAEEDMEGSQIRLLKDELRAELGMIPTDEIYPDHEVDLPWVESGSTGLGKHKDDLLQTDIPNDELAKVLAKVEKERLRFQREKGLPVLFAGFGFLEWCSEGSSDGKMKRFNSPLLLMEISIDRSNKIYRIVGKGDLFANPDLPHAILRETSNSIPPIEEFMAADKELSLNAYFKSIGDQFRDMHDWKIRNRIAMGIFKSKGIPVSEVLREGYAEDRINQAEQLLVGTSNVASRVTNRKVDDIKSRELVPGFALPVDASQHATILKVAEGSNLVIEGPPGTGKSQTIVNLIATALNQGKSVLFLAQKLAALEVVQHRLKHSGLGGKCVAIHSEYTNRKKFFAELKEKIDQVSPPNCTEEFNEIRNRRDEVIDQLNGHAHFLGSGFSDNNVGDGLTVQRILTTHTFLKDKIEGEEILGLTLGDVYGSDELKEDLRNAHELSERISELNDESRITLQFFRYTEIPGPFEMDEILNELKACVSALEGFNEEILEKNQLSLLQDEKFWQTLLEAKIGYGQNIEKILTVFDSHEDPNIDEFLKYSKSLGTSSNWMRKLWSTKLKWTKSYISRQWMEGFLNLDPEDSSFHRLIERSSEIRLSILAFRNYQGTLQENSNSDMNLNSIQSSFQRATYQREILERSIRFLERIMCQAQGELVKDFLKSLQSLSLSPKDFFNLCSINHGLLEFDKRLGCGEWMRHSILNGLPISERLEAHIFQNLAKKIASKNKAIFQMDRSKLVALRQRLDSLEEESRQKFCKMLAAASPDPEAVPTANERRVRDKSGLALLKHVASKPTARVTVRELCTRAADALQCYSPCFLMTPSSVADFLPKELSFDLLIIDEASQMLTEEAIGSILRSKQIVVVGDQKQMPPTKYMQSTLHEVGEDEEKNESILDKSILYFEHFSRLNYHYRSADETLIQFSNHQFYDGELMIPPSHGADENLGLKFVDAEGVYQAGKGALANAKNPNPIEAEKLVELIIEEIRERPGSSLGVAVMNLRQAERVEELFQAKIDDQIREYINQWIGTPEYFFIKNLENVQGDERDSMIIATVYGKTKEGKSYQRFGPINSDKGENRINVLVTRAKKRVVVCTSMNPVEITNKSSGAQVLKRYLDYAKTGRLEGATGEVEQADEGLGISLGWEKWFADRLRSDGFEVDTEVGSSAWKIDLAIKDPDKEGAYLCGIELDGPTKLKRSARDREILSQAVLESKGWKILRVETIDFFIDPESEYQQLKEGISIIMEASAIDQRKLDEEEELMKEAFDGSESTVSRSDILSF